MLPAMHLRSALGLAAFLAAFVLNPAFFAGCAADSVNFQYGAKEMSALARAGSRNFEFTSDNVRYRLELTVKAKSKPSHAALRANAWSVTAHACGQRTLYASAAACLDASSLPVTGTMSLIRVLDDGSEMAVVTDAALSGDLFVPGTVLDSGELYLDFDHGHIELDSRDGKTFKLATFDADWPGDLKLSITG
jgi:hypothetical protein